ncbi:hypothetical protein E3N88_41109 [Mikania micrantha]|uniref:Uncharacterized protein n=1 Tax=Mikania micrantha TaxID=192012 RepID=A0A5N6LPG6_9ASTR|nr:hypothetical protein E3N88_41109 [Mikania micrantha]
MKELIKPVEQVIYVERWTHHGESLIPVVVVADDVIPTNDMAGIIEDVMEERMEDDPNLDEETRDESIGVHDDFEDLLKEVQSKEGTMRHPVDGSASKEFDKNYPNFLREP